MALRDINIIPADYLHQRRVLRHVGLWSGCLVLFLSLIFGYYFYQTLVVLPKKRPVTTVADMQKHLGATIGEIEATEQEIERLNTQESFLKRFTRNQPFSLFLLGLSQTVNPQTWLTKLNIDSASEERDQFVRNVRLYGYALSNDDLGDFLTRLSGNPVFQRVILKFARETEISIMDKEQKNRVKVIQFQIDSEILGS
jgi:Tfp pilus assembly protein PilN